MQDHEGLTPAERELETVLAGLKPSVGVMNRDRLMFEAGRAAARRRNRLWQGLASSLAVLLVVSILIRPKPKPIETSAISVARNVPSVTTQSLEPTDEKRLEALRQYVHTRRTVLERGVEALGPPSSRRTSPSEPDMSRRSLDEFLSST